MRIGGLQKTTLLDFPGKVSAVVFTAGCNFLCPYCHNAALTRQEGLELALADVLAFLARRRRQLEGVVISGGEPCLQEDLVVFCATVKSLGYAIKLDTNGSRPEMLRHLLALDLLDYVAVDLKTDPASYPASLSPRSPGSSILDSVAVLRKSRVAHEFRVPCAAPFVDARSFAAILRAVDGQAPIRLQPVRLEEVLDPTFFTQAGRALNREEIESLRQLALAGGQDCTIRQS